MFKLPIALSVVAIALCAGVANSQSAPSSVACAVLRLLKLPLPAVCNPKTVSAPMTNWGGNFNFSTNNVFYPRTTADVANIVANVAGPMRAYGSRHSFSTIADSNGTLISMSAMTQILGVGVTVVNGTPTISSVTVQAGAKYTDIVPFLASQQINRALPVMASLAEISVAGAMSTGAHGSGYNLLNLASSVSGMEVVWANGTVTELTRANNPTLMQALGVGLGAMGIITQVTIDLVDSFQAQTNVFMNLSMDTALANLETIYSDAYAVYLWTDWGQTDNFTQVWLTSKVGDDDYTDWSENATYFGATAAIADVTPLAALPVPFVAPQMGVVDSWYRRLTNYGLGLSGFNGAEIESEYFVRLSNASAAIAALKPLAPQINPIVYVSLIRIIAPDDHWMSQANGADAEQEHTVAIHFTWVLNLPAVKAVLPQIEAALAPFNPVPHWGKLFTMDPCSTFLKHYSKLADFKALDSQIDPTGKFHNAFLNANVFAACTASSG